MGTKHELLAAHWPAVAKAIHASNSNLVLSMTGGGSQALSALLTVPGASRTVLDAHVPYAAKALARRLGSPPDQACSSATARAMAMASWMRARELAPDLNTDQLVGVGCTASLATDREKRGEHRVHLAVQTARFTRCWNLHLDRQRSRQEQESLTASLVLQAIAEASETDSANLDCNRWLTDQERLHSSEQLAPEPWQALLIHGQDYYAQGGPDVLAINAQPPTPRLVFPGSFNPLHHAHRQMAQIAEQRIGHALAWEISVTNVDKPPLDCLALAQRQQAMQQSDPTRWVYYTNVATFSAKAAIHPDCTFVIGADTVVRIADERYYASVAERDAAVTRFTEHGGRFLVFGRTINGGFQTLSHLTLPPALRAVCEGVTADDFREDVSSTELRTKDDR